MRFCLHINCSMIVRQTSRCSDVNILTFEAFEEDWRSLGRQSHLTENRTFVLHRPILLLPGIGIAFVLPGNEYGA
jgi:hypothetical protein